MTPSPARPTPRRTGPLLGTLALTLALAVTLTACGDDATDATDEPSPVASSAAPSDGTPTASPTTPATTPATPTEAPGGDTGTSETIAPIYFVGETPQGPRLFREFQPLTEAEVAASPGGVDVALARSAAGESLDPDYSSLLPAGAPTATTGDGLIQITLPDASWTTRPDDLSPREARVAVQQLVYTAQAALQERIPVAFLLDGSVSPVLGIEAPEGVRAAKQLNVLALVNLEDPQEGAAVSGSFTATGLASSFEATVPWELRDADGAVALEGFATAEGFVDRLYPFTTQIDATGLAPGQYVLAARTDDPSGGEGTGTTEDTVSITLE